MKHRPAFWLSFIKPSLIENGSVDRVHMPCSLLFRIKSMPAVRKVAIAFEVSWRCFSSVVYRVTFNVMVVILKACELSPFCISLRSASSSAALGINNRIGELTVFVSEPILLSLRVVCSPVLLI